ncbi:GGDEF domain-containing protein [Novispirillum itersonii]|uniref:GGDEF domain-containing protein n=1 Tax=Novispirillum itersonii TaxID=189 RepID=UPI0003A1C8D2|nr:GGDEF domain-containing protein [Novispirillum itersonii]
MSRNSTTDRASGLIQPDSRFPSTGTADEIGDRASAHWRAIQAAVSVCLQPVISIHSGRCVGFETVLSGYERLGYASASGLLDAAHGLGALPDLEHLILDRALSLFCGGPDHPEQKLFLNIDTRSLSDARALAARITRYLQQYGLNTVNLVIEVAERHPIADLSQIAPALTLLRQAAGGIGLDNFGAGYSGLPLLYSAQPDYIKIDRFFIANAEVDTRKRAFLTHIVNLAHLLGVQVIAEGVDSDREYMLCRDSGCDLVQGFAISPPLSSLTDATPLHDGVRALNAQDRRNRGSDIKLVSAQIEVIPPLPDTASLDDAFERLRTGSTTFLPVVSALGEPLGLLREKDLKAYVYSPFGKDLLSNKVYGRGPRHFLWPCPTAEVSARAEKILEIFSSDEESEGIILTEDGRYAGFLSARSLLRILNEKNLAVARDQNPLTKLPGNAVINDHLTEALADRGAAYTIAYIDFDFFKPFNDSYGFRQGDRAITLYADILRKDLPRDLCFIGHVGGDDFFASIRHSDCAEAVKMIRHTLDRFCDEVESFYDEESRRRGYILGKDRDGKDVRLPLLRASAGVLHITSGQSVESIDEVSGIFARLKKQAKASPSGMAVAMLGPVTREEAACCPEADPSESV